MRQNEFRALWLEAGKQIPAMVRNDQVPGAGGWVCVKTRLLIVAFHRANASGQLHQHSRSPSSSDAVDLFVMAWIVSTTAHSLESGQALLQPHEVVWSQPTPATFHDTNASVRQEPA